MICLPNIPTVIMLITFTIDQIECRPIDKARSSYLIMFCSLRQVFMKCIIVHIDNHCVGDTYEKTSLYLLLYLNIKGDTYLFKRFRINLQMKMTETKINSTLITHL